MKKAIVVLILALLPLAYFKIKHFIGIDTCLDSSLCAENLKIKTEHGLIEINKENCLKHNWRWSEKNKMCKVDFEKIR